MKMMDANEDHGHHHSPGEDRAAGTLSKWGASFYELRVSPATRASLGDLHPGRVKLGGQANSCWLKSGMVTAIFKNHEMPKA